ncbi:MAG: hypothetical protein ABH843_08215 [Candidatus Omnitrophota bacterium]
MYSIYKSATFRIAILVVACLLLISVNKAYAQAAVQVINGAGGGTVTVTVRNRSGTQAADGVLRWTGASDDVGKWQTSDQYIEIEHSGLPINWGMQIYTDNMNSTPAYTGGADPAGLVAVGNTLTTVPLAWRITDKPPSGYTVADEDPYNDANKVERPDHDGMASYAWHFMKDKNTPDDPTTAGEDEAFVNGDDYVVAWTQKGIGWNEGAKAGNPKKAYLYLAARFTTAPIGVEYKTTKLMLEVFRGASPFPIYLYKDAPLTDYPNEAGATLENHFSPSGWMNYNDASPHITVDAKCKEVTPKSGTHCFKMTWNGQGGADTWKWGGIMWLEPDDIWTYGASGSPTHNGYDLRDADYVSFWARTDAANQGLELKSWFGNAWDSCGETPSIWRSPSLTTSWQQFLIPVLGRDMSNVTGGLGIVFADDHDPNPDGCVIYLDEIKYGKY